MDKKTYWYRVTETTYSAGVDDYGDPIPGGPTKTNLDCCEVLRLTPCGAWVDDLGTPRFVNLSWNKRYALPTVQEAVVSFKARKHRQIQIARSTIACAEESLRYLDNHGFYNDSRKWVGGVGVEVPL